MYLFLLILILLGAALALVTGVRALGAYLSYRRVRVAFEGQVTGEVDRLSRRANELEGRLSVLGARAEELPVRISELQRSLATLRALSGALAGSLRQAQKVLSYGALKTLSADRIGNLLRRPG